jgi:hypothetical protein
VNSVFKIQACIGKIHQFWIGQSQSSTSAFDRCESATGAAVDNLEDVDEVNKMRVLGGKVSVEEPFDHVFLANRLISVCQLLSVVRDALIEFHNVAVKHTHVDFKV